jgi:hypothetical protein
VTFAQFLATIVSTPAKLCAIAKVWYFTFIESDAIVITKHSGLGNGFVKRKGGIVNV